jgi:hypothetical protein
VGIAQTDEELAGLMGRSSKAIGGESFCGWVEEEQQRSLGQFKAPKEIGMRRREVGSRSGVDYDHRELSLWSRTAGTAPTAFAAAGGAVVDPAAGGGGGAEWPKGGAADGVGQLGRREPSSAGVGG